MANIFFGDEQITTANLPPLIAPIGRLPRASFDVFQNGRLAQRTTPTGVQSFADPRTRLDFDRFRNQAFSNVGRIQGLSDSLAGNRNPFIQARVDPLQQEINQRFASTREDLARRGVMGGIADNELNKVLFQGQRELGNARALATQEGLNAQLAAEGQLIGANDAVLQAAQQGLKEELSRLGVDLTALELSQGNQLQSTQAFGGGAVQTTEGGQSLVDTIFQFGRLLGL